VIYVAKEISLPVLQKIELDFVWIMEKTNQIRKLHVHDQIYNWTLMAIVKMEEHDLVAIFEDFSCPRGSLVYINDSGLVLKLNKSLEETRVDETECYLGYSKEKVLRSERDILREKILGENGDPDYEVVASCFPPITRSKYGAQEGMHTFVGSRNSIDTVPIYYSALEGGTWRVHPAIVSPEIGDAMRSGRIAEGLVGDWLPVVRFCYEVDDNTYWEMVVFGVVDPPNNLMQPVCYRFLKIQNGEVVDARYINSFYSYPLKKEESPGEFYLELQKLHQDWKEPFNDAMKVKVPEQWVISFSRHSMAREMITRIGNHPRYGLLNRFYGGREHDGFQDIINSSLSCYLEWGLFDLAKGYLDYYFDEFVNEDGTINYRGPEIGQYARMLTNIALYVDFTKDEACLTRHEEKICAITEILMERRLQAKKLCPDSVTYGLIRGRHEADISFDSPLLTSYDFEQPYFSNSTETWRAFHDLGNMYRRIGSEQKDQGLLEKGMILVNEAKSLYNDIKRSIALSVFNYKETPYLPTIAGSKECHLLTPYRSKPESFDDNRVWSEVLHSGITSKETAQLIIDFAAKHEGSILGIFRNRRETVVAFQCYGAAYGMLQHDMIHEFLLFLYSHALHLHTRGTWTVFECVDMDRDRADHLPYCAPAQLTIPNITKWMLVFEEPASLTLWLAKATPRKWLESGESIEVTNAPTRWGRLSYSIKSKINENLIIANMDLPLDINTDIKLRFRTPGQREIQRVLVDGTVWENFDSQEETVTISGKHGSVKVEVYY